MTRQFLALCMTGMLLAGCVSSSFSSDTAAVERQNIVRQSAYTGADFDVATPKAFSNAKNIVIGGFKVGFVESKADATTTVETSANQTVARLKIQDLEPGLLQAITDAAYEDFTARMSAAGYNIIDSTDFYGSPEFEKIKMYDMPYDVDNSSLLSNYGITHYYAPSVLGPKAPIFVGEIEGRSGGLIFSNPAPAAASYAERTGNRVINVSYVIDFSDFVSTEAEGEIEGEAQGLSLAPGAVIAIIGGQGGTFSTAVGSIRVGQPIYATDYFGTVEDKTSDATKSMEKATKVINVIGLKAKITHDYIVRTDPEKYQATAGGLAIKANKALIGKMKTLQ